MTDNTTGDDWRAENEVHPAADLFPMMSDPELDELAADIAKHGLQQPIVWLKGQILDGRNRVEAIHRISDKQRQQEIVRDLQNGKHTKNLLTHPDPVGYVISANMHRRHLTAEQKREVIAKVLRERPGESDRAIGKMVKVDNKTVASVRADLQRREEIPHVTTRTDTKGRQQPARKPPPQSPPLPPRTAATVTDANPTAEEQATHRDALDALLYQREIEKGELERQVEILSQTRRENGKVYIDVEVLAAEFLPLLDHILQNEKAHQATYVSSVAPYNVIKMQRLIKAWLAGEPVSREKVPFRSGRGRFHGPFVEKDTHQTDEQGEIRGADVPPDALQATPGPS